MTDRRKSKKELFLEIDGLKARLAEAEEALRAIRHGEVDAIIGPSSDGDRVYTLQGAEDPYRVFFEAMLEGAVTMTPGGMILYCNAAFAALAKVPLENLPGMSFPDLVAEDSRRALAALLRQTGPQNPVLQTSLIAQGSGKVPVTISLSRLSTKDLEAVCAIITDLSGLLLMKQLTHANEELIAIDKDRTASQKELQVSEKKLRDAHRAALNLIEDAVEARKQAEATNDELRREVVERKRAEQELLRNREDLDRAQAVGSLGSWRLDVRRNLLAWSDENHRIFGIPKGTPLSYETFLSAVHPDDRAQVDAQWRMALQGEPYDLEHRIVAGGRVKWVREKAYLEFDRNGALIGGFGITQDISDRKRAEEALQKTLDSLEQRVAERTRELSVANESVRTERQRLFDVLETLPVYVILLDADHHIPFANRFFRERFSESGGRRCYEYLFNRTEPCETCETYTVMETNAPHHWYWTGPDKRDYDIYDFPFVDSDGATMILEMGIDITDQKKAQQALRETIAELQEATRRAELTSSLLALITQKNTRREYLDATCDLLQSWSGLRHVGVRVTGPNREIPFESCKGYDPAFLAQEGDLSLAEDHCICTRIIAGAPEPPDLNAMTPKGSFYSGDALAFVDRLSEHDRTHYRGTCMKHRYRSLAVIPILYRGNPVGAVHLADERPGMLPRTTVEVLEQVAQIIGEAIYRFGVEEEQMRLVSALESSADGVVITNPKNGTILYVNSAFERMTGYSREEAVGSTLHLLDSGKHDEAFYQELRAALAREGVWRGVLMNRKKDGTLYYEECSFSPVREHDGSIINYVSVKRDITEKLRLESIAESVTSMNNIGYIFAGVRHEIGNPINSAKMMLSVLQLKLETAAKETIKSYVDRSLVEIGRVEILLRNLKNFNLYETPELKDLHLPSFLREFQNLVAGDLGQKGIAFKQNIPEDVERARIDPRALQQVLINLVTNAADAVAGTKDPSIEISVRREPGLLHIEVTDNGAGLTEQQQKDLFKPFYTSKVHGTGLGLVIVKKLLTRMNCGISVTSMPGDGTIVDITVPEESS